MRALVRIAGVMALLLLISAVDAQGLGMVTGPDPTSFGGVRPDALKNKPIDTSGVLKAANAQAKQYQPAQPHTFSITDYFPHFAIPGWGQPRPSTPILPRANNPFQPKAVVKKDAFGNTY